MSTPLPPHLQETFWSLAQVVYSGGSFDSVYDAVCASAVELVDGCDHASLMVRRHGRVQTVAASDETARLIDDLEKEVGQGPCLDAMDDVSPDQHLCSDLADGGSWPELSALIRARTPVRGMAGFRLRRDGEKVGALNVFSDTAGALTSRSLDQAGMLSAFASVALAAVERGEEATTLRRGLESNREIGKAVGLLMAMHDVDDDQAFAMLSKVSQEMNVKVAQVASQVIAHHRPKAGKPPAPRSPRSN